MNQKLRSINICKVCSREYERGFYGAGPVYCSHKCNRKGRYAVDKLRLRKRYVRKDKDCKMCGRNILKVGLRQFANKYCSKKCMNLAQRVKDGREFCTIRVPISELPRLFSQIS